jgi:hypothetical protein
MGAGLRPKAKGLDKPPDPTVRAPVLDPTECGGGRRLIRGTDVVTLVPDPAEPVSAEPPYLRAMEPARPAPQS